MAHIYIHYSRVKESPWAVTVTSADRTKLITQDQASAVEINIPCKTFLGKLHYIYCEGVVTWQGTKAIINSVK